jgi:Fe2+ transport system protein FeoA
MSRTLADLKPGERGRVIRIGGDGAIMQRLMAMGLLEDVEVEVVRRAPAGDPIEIRLMDYSLSLRRDEARAIEVG